MNTRHYVQYIDESYSLKVKPLEYVDYYYDEVNDENLGGHYLLEGIDVQFFIVGVFIDNKRIDRVEFIRIDNLFMTSIINDLEMSDLNVIPLNHFFEANKKVRFELTNVGVDVPIVNAMIYGAIPRHDVDVKSMVRHQVDVMSMPSGVTVPELIIYNRPTLVKKNFIGGSLSSRYDNVSVFAKVTIRIYLDGSYDLLDNTVISNLVPNNYTTLNTASRIASGKSFPFFNFFIKPVDLSGGAYVFSDFTQFEMFFNLKTKEFAVVHRKFRLNDYGTEVELFYNNIIQNYRGDNDSVTLKSPDALAELTVSNKYI
ncbi:hypothetical protein [Flavobacterium sp. KBS0721]|uniref:hypothetical protein n=1 Tax=Flavobacterium sp. KBS0721 TaxID=1179672 RepID=UPI00099018EE|nr:hypothetical protein [Flavobacterium sp. KBS0721]QDW21818.1 hypothetical protein B0M43_0017430 [Flavobacterium sp. KBS0721]